MENLNKILEIFAEKFEHILPHRTDARVLFSLFIDNKENPEKTSYSESEIKELIKKYYKAESDSNTDREQRQKVEERLQILLRQQFIDRNIDKRIVLTDYSLQLCNLFYEKVQPMLNPSAIEKILENVKATLQISCESVADLDIWYKTQFLKILKTEIANQTIAMEFQIAELKRDLNEKFKSLQYEDLVDYCHQQMESVIADRKKLTKSFDGLNSISEILSETSLNKLSDIKFIQIKSNLNETLDHYKYKLERTEDNISKIKQIVRSLYDIIGKKTFDRKLEAFFYQILEQSQTEKKQSRTDTEDNFYYSVEISLPANVDTISFVKNTPDAFLYPEFYENFSVSKNQKAETISRNLNNMQTAADKSRKRQEQARKIEKWLLHLRELILEKEEIDYSSFYMEMLTTENDVELAIKGTEYFLKKLRQEKYKVETTMAFSIDTKHPNNAIWNIKIKKPSSN